MGKKQIQFNLEINHLNAQSEEKRKIKEASMMPPMKRLKTSEQPHTTDELKKMLSRLRPLKKK